MLLDEPCAGMYIICILFVYVLLNIALLTNLLMYIYVYIYTGLDPLSRRNLRAMITACMRDRAVVLTTHSMVSIV